MGVNERLSEELLPETVSEEMWVLQGRAKALKGYLRWAKSMNTVYKTVDIEAVCEIMGFDIPETKGE